MRAIWVSLLFLESSFAALSEWQSLTHDLCDSGFRLACTYRTELAIGKAAYRSEYCSCTGCQGNVFQNESALKDVVKGCSGESFCELDLLPRRDVSCDCHNKVLDVEYACVQGYSVQAACGNDDFDVRDQGFVANDKFPEKSEMRRCAIIFDVDETQMVAIRPLTLDLPGGWDAHFCNLSGCEPIDTEQLQLTGQSHIRIMPQDEVPDLQGENLTFAFEYEVTDMSTPIVQPKAPKVPDFNPSEVGVIRLEKKTKTAAIVAGVTIPASLIVVFVAVWIYKAKHPEKQKVEHDDDSTSPRDLYYKDVLRHRNSCQSILRQSTTSTSA